MRVSAFAAVCGVYAVTVLSFTTGLVTAGCCAEIHGESIALSLTSTFVGPVGGSKRLSSVFEEGIQHLQHH